MTLGTLGTGGSSASGPSGEVTASSGVSTSSSSGAPSASCGVTTLASGLHYPAAMAYAGDAVYVATNDAAGGTTPGTGLVLKVPLAGGEPVVLASGQGNPWGIAADATNVYWTSSDGTVKKVPPSGGTPTVLAAGQSDPGRVVVDDTRVYWGNRGDDAVVSVPIAGGPPTVLSPASSNAYAPVMGLAVDGADVYFSAPGEEANTGVVMKVPLGGGAPTTLASGLMFAPNSVAVDTEFVYFALNGNWLSNADGNGAVAKVPLAGGPVVTLASGLLQPSNVVESAGHLYWGGGFGDDSPQPTNIVPETTSVSQASTLGGAEETIDPASIVRLSGLVVCPGGVCWTDAFTGTVKRYVACSP